MISKHNRPCVISVLFVLILALSGCSKDSGAKVPQDEILDMDQKILSFKLANHSETGSKKWVLKGDSANILSDVIFLTNIRAKTFDEPQINLTSVEGTYDRKSRVVTLIKDVELITSDDLKLTTDLVTWDGETDIISTPKLVKIERADVITTGTGAKALPQMKKIMLNKDVKVVLLKDAMSGAPLASQDIPAQDGEEYKVTITCRGPLEIDYEKNIAVFNEAVEVDDKRGKIFADRMDAYLDPVSKSIVKVIAEGGVKVIRGKDSTYSERAIYTTADQRIVLLGKPRIFIHADKEIEKIEKGFSKGTGF